jgi:5-methylcytosine-specific restriction endonuclease McrA
VKCVVGRRAPNVPFLSVQQAQSRSKEVTRVNGVLVLNADLGPLHRVSLQHAVRMLLRQVAEVHEAVPDRLIGVYPVPRVVRLVRYVVTRWRFGAGPGWSRAGVRARDGPRCAYCGGHASTVDHVVPRSRGGRNTWLNTVAACGSCNQRKDDRTPEEAGMVLRVHPTAPSWAALVR